MERWVGPPLTTIRQPLTEMAAAAARLVLGQGGEERIELATSLVVRQSTANTGPEGRVHSPVSPRGRNPGAI